MYDKSPYHSHTQKATLKTRNWLYFSVYYSNPTFISLTCVIKYTSISHVAFLNNTLCWRYRVEICLRFTRVSIVRGYIKFIRRSSLGF